MIETIERICLHCNKPFLTQKCYLKRGGGKYCSHKCSGAASIGNTPWNKGKKTIKFPTIPMLCACGCGGTVWDTKRQYKLGHWQRNKPSWNKGKTGIFSKETLEKMSKANTGRVKSTETCRKLSEALQGHPVSERSIAILVERSKGNKWNVGRKPSEETKKKMREHNQTKRPDVREKMSKAKKGKHLSPQTEFKKGVIPANTGKRYKNPKVQGERNGMYGVIGELHPNWKGGRKIAWRRSYNKRKREYKFTPLNDCENESWEGHHLDKEYVLYIPKELHKSIFHTQSNQASMDRINEAVINWYIWYYGLI